MKIDNTIKFPAVALTYTLAVGVGAQSLSSNMFEENEPLRIRGTTIIPLSSSRLPEDARKILSARIQASKEKVSEVSDRELPDFEASIDRVIPQLRPYQTLMNEKQLAVRPAQLHATELDGAQELGAVLAGTKLENGWTGLVRVFHLPKFGFITLEELDFGATGGGIGIVAELVNNNVNGQPAVLLSQRTASGRSLTTLSWASSTKRYKLKTKEVDDIAREYLVDVARNIKE